MTELIDHDLIHYMVENAPLVFIILVMVWYLYARCDCTRGD